MGPVLYQLYFKRIPRFKIPAEHNSKSNWKLKNRKQRKRKIIETEKIVDWLTWPQPTAPAH
jgi:hypothetical protein